MSHVQENIIARFYTKFNQLREEEKYTDVTFECESKNFKCHRLVLIVASPYFEAMFGSNFKESTLKNIVLQEVTAATFEEVLRFMYTGNIDVNVTNVYDLLRMSDYYSLPDIKDLCLRFVTDNKHLISIRNVIPMFLYACDTKKDDFTSCLSSLIADNFGVYCKLEQFLEISFEHLQLILHQYLSLSSRNEESLLTAILRWTSHKRGERLKHLDGFLGRIQFESISPAYIRLVTKMFMAEQDPVIALKRPSDCDTVLESQKDKILKIANGLHVYVRYKMENLIRIFSVSSSEVCTTSGEIIIADQHTDITSVVSDDLILYSLNYLSSHPQEANREKQTFCAHTSVDQRATSTLTPPPLLFTRASICYLQNNIYAYDEFATSTPSSVIRTKSESAKMFNDEEILRGIFVYNCSSDNWFPVPQMKKRLYHSCMTVCENTLYLIGGSESVNGPPSVGYAQAFDFRAGWRTLPNSHGKYCFTDCCSFSGKIYVCGGTRNPKHAERYDPIAGKWERIQSIDDRSVFHRMIPFDNKIWVFGSLWRPSSNLYMNVYDIALNQWSKSSILAEVAASIVDSIYILDGIVFSIL